MISSHRLGTMTSSRHNAITSCHQIPIIFRFGQTTGVDHVAVLADSNKEDTDCSASTDVF